MRPLNLYKQERLRWADKSRKRTAGSFLVGEPGSLCGRSGFEHELGRSGRWREAKEPKD